jgi:hypothetical protein
LFPEVKSPLVNVVCLFIEAIEEKDFELFRVFVGTYQSQLERDPKFIEYVDRIA